MAGDLLRIADGAIEVELFPAAGGRIHRIRAFGQDLIRTPPDPVAHLREPFAWGGYVMAPWCNRISTLPTPVGDRVVRVGPNFPDGSAIHGQVLAVPWAVGHDGSLSVRGGDDAWPWTYEVVERVTVADGHIRIGLTLTNLADVPMPGGIGLHPWFVRPLEVAIDASRVVASNLDPGADDEAVHGSLDLRTIGRPAIGLDATWLGVGSPAARLRWPGLGIEAALRIHADVPSCLAMANLEDPDAVAIEPETHAPQGLRRLLDGRAFGLRMLEPGGSLHLDIDLEIGRTG